MVDTCKYQKGIRSIRNSTFGLSFDLTMELSIFGSTLHRPFSSTLQLYNVHCYHILRNRLGSPK